MDFFIALFGGIYLLWQCASDKIKSNNSKLEYESYRKYSEDIAKIVVASGEEAYEAKQRLLGGKCVDEVYDELEEDFKFVYGQDCDIRKILPLPKNYSLVACPFKNYTRNDFWAYSLLLAHQGKVYKSSYDFGYQLGGIDHYKNHIKFCQLIEKHLNEHNKNLKLYLEPKYSTYTKSYNMNPMAQVVKFEHQIYKYSPKIRLW